MAKNSFLINQHETFFDLYQPSEVKPAFDHGLKVAHQLIKEIYNIKDIDRNFSNTVLAVSRASDIIEYIASIVYHLFSVNDEQWYQPYLYVQDEILKYGNKITFDLKIYQALIAVRDSQMANMLAEEVTILNRMIREYENNGIHLNIDVQKQLKKLNINESKLITKFDKNILDYKKRHPLYIKSIQDLKGISPNVIEQWRQAATKAKYENGFLIELSDDNQYLILANAQQERLRKKLDKAVKSIAHKANLSLTLKILAIRWRKAELLGKNNPSEYLMQDRMIKDPQTALDFINQLKPYYQKRALKEYKQILDFKNKSLKENREYLREYDYEYRTGLYWKDKLYQYLYDVDMDYIKDYCQLDIVLNAMLQYLGEMYKVTFKPSKVKSWNKNNKVYEIIDNGKILSIIHIDLFSRKDKKDGAWMNSLILRDRGDAYPSSVVVIMNLSEPSLKQPTLMSLNDISTLWHEFGHCLHGVFSNTIYQENNAMQCAWDFIEMPSQLMENYFLEPHIVKRYARHYKTQELLPEKYIQKIIQAKDYMDGVVSLRQCYLASLDLLLHSQAQLSSTKELDDFQKQLKEKFSIGPTSSYFSTLNTFSHIHHGYKSGYYTYKWSESLQADVFSIFKKEGLFNTDIWHKYRELILSKGASIDPNILMTDFLGRKINQKAILEQ